MKIKLEIETTQAEPSKHLRRELYRMFTLLGLTPTIDSHNFTWNKLEINESAPAEQTVDGLFRKL